MAKMNDIDKYVGDEVLPCVNSILELLNPTVAEIAKKAINSATVGAVDVFEILRLNMREQNFRKLLENIDNTEELKRFIGSADKKQKDFMMQVLIKTANLENDIQIFIMSRIVQNLKNNGELSYYESSLFTNINSLTLEDFEIFYRNFSNKKPIVNDNVLLDDIFYFETSPQNTYYAVSIDKLKNIGIIQDAQLSGGKSYPEDGVLKINFQVTEYTDVFFGYLKEYFEPAN